MPYFDVTVHSEQQITIEAADEVAAREAGIEAINASNDLPEGQALSPYLITTTVVEGAVTVRASRPEQAALAIQYTQETYTVAAREKLTVIK